MSVIEAGIAQPVIELTRDEAWQDFDEKTRAMLDVDATTFMHRLDSGFYRNFDDSEGDLMYLMLLSRSFRDVSYPQAGD